MIGLGMGSTHVLVLFLCTMFAVGLDATPLEAQKAVGRSSLLFAAKAYQQLKSTPGNILVCPVSVQTVLALVQAGANQETSSQIQTALSLPEDKSLSQSGFKQMMQTLKNAKEVTLDIANKVYIKDGFEIAPAFNDIAVNSFQAGIENLNFANNVESANHINRWVSEKTNEKIQEIVSKNDINSQTRMVLVNALYFKGKWANAFQTYDTYDQDFFIGEEKSVKIPMMHKTDNFQYAENKELDAKFLELPYKGGEIVMTIVLPNQRTGLAALEEKIDQVLAPQKYSDEFVRVTLPRFTIETKIEFNEVLQKLGMEKAFSNEADFSGLSAKGEPLKISKVVQKNFINVTEEGTEAASATAGVIKKNMPAENFNGREFIINHPFMFGVWNKEIGVNMYLGRFNTIQ